MHSCRPRWVSSTLLRHSKVNLTLYYITRTQNLSYAFDPPEVAVSSRGAGSLTPPAPKHDIRYHVKNLNTPDLNNEH